MVDFRTAVEKDLQEKIPLIPAVPFDRYQYADDYAHMLPKVVMVPLVAWLVLEELVDSLLCENALDVIGMNRTMSLVLSAFLSR